MVKYFGIASMQNVFLTSTGSRWLDRTEKNNQLAAIRAILEDKRFANVSGLKGVLGKYITEQENQAKAEDTKLSSEELEVVEEKNRLRDHPCP